MQKSGDVMSPISDLIQSLMGVVALLQPQLIAVFSELNRALKRHVATHTKRKSMEYCLSYGHFHLMGGVWGEALILVHLKP